MIEAGEEEFEIYPVMVVRRCTVCEKGELRPTGDTLLSMPPRFPHACTTEGCSGSGTFWKRYPVIRFYHDHGRGPAYEL